MAATLEPWRQAHIIFSFKMAGQTTTAKFSDLYDLKEELGK